MTKQFPLEDLKKIAQAMMALENEQDAELFLRAFLTPKECETICDRYKIVELLLQKVPQREIAAKLGVSLSQISRGSEELQFGVGAKIFPKVFSESSKTYTSSTK